MALVTAFLAFLAIVLLLTLIVFTACGSGPDASAPVPPNAEAPAAAPAAPDQGAAAGYAETFPFSADSETVVWGAYEEDSLAYTGQLFALHDRMVIRNAHLSMETMDFENTANSIEAVIASYGGFIESSNRWMVTVQDTDFWNAEYTLRVPVEHFDEANGRIMALGHVVSFSTSSEDVTMQFQDMEGRLSIREEEERRILAMIENTDDLADLITLEVRLANLRITMEGYRRSMSEIDHLASFSTISLFLREVTGEDGIMPTWDGFSGRMASAFGSSVSFSLSLIEGFAVLIATIILPLAVLAAPVLIVVLVVKRITKRRVP